MAADGFTRHQGKNAGAVVRSHGSLSPTTILLTLTLALWALCAAPLAQRIESSIGTYPIPKVIGMSPSPPFITRAKVIDEETFDFRGIVFYRLELSGGGAAVCSLDSALPLASWFAAHNHSHIHLALSDSTLESLAR